MSISRDYFCYHPVILSEAKDLGLAAEILRFAQDDEVASLRIAKRRGVIIQQD